MFVILKDNIVIATCNMAPCADDLASRGEVAVELAAPLGAAVVDNTVYECPNNTCKFDTEKLIWVDTRKLTDIKTECIDKINYQAGLARKKYSTTSFGQQELYAEKFDQATRFLKTKKPDIAAFPLIGVEAKILKLSGKEIAERIVKANTNHTTIMTEIEHIRLSANYKCSKARTAKAVEDIQNKAVKALDAI